MKTQTKIIATVGLPDKKPYANKLAEEGADIIRVNTKYGSEKDWTNIINKVKKTKSKILIDIPSPKSKNHQQLQNYNYLAISFTETAGQIKKIKQNLPKVIKVIAKIENKKGIKNIDEIIKASDGVMVARGDLGKNIPFEKVPFVQKLIMKKCNKKGRLDITATEMLLSMLHSKSPSRADVSDIANAVLDGSDALMLSEETAIGDHPILCIKTMRKIIREAEKYGPLLNK